MAVDVCRYILERSLRTFISSICCASVLFRIRMLYSYTWFKRLAWTRRPWLYRC